MPSASGCKIIIWYKNIKHTFTNFTPVTLINNYIDNSNEYLILRLVSVSNVNQCSMFQMYKNVNIYEDYESSRSNNKNSLSVKELWVNEIIIRMCVTMIRMNH